MTSEFSAKNPSFVTIFNPKKRGARSKVCYVVIILREIEPQLRSAWICGFCHDANGKSSKKPGTPYEKDCYLGVPRPLESQTTETNN